MSSYKPLPKHKPHDIIRSEEWNIISDDLEYLRSKIGAGVGGGGAEIEVETSDWTLADRKQVFPPPQWWVGLYPLFYTENAIYLWGGYYQDDESYYIYKKVTWDGLIEDLTSDEITFASQYWFSWVIDFYVAHPLLNVMEIGIPWGSIFGRYTLGMDSATFDKIYVARAKIGQPLQIIKTLQPIDSGKKFCFQDSQGYHSMFAIITYNGKLIMALEAEDSYDTKDGAYLDVWKAVE